VLSLGLTLFVVVVVRVMWAVFLTASTVGFHIVGSAIVKRREMQAEQRRMRLAILPFLQAEQDLMCVWCC
jgi:hypothetical protein